MILHKSPFLYEADKGDGQDGDGPKGQEPNGLEELSKKFENFSKTASKWSNEIGEIRKQGEELQELKETIGGFAEQFNAIQESLNSRNVADEDEFNPFDQNQLTGLFGKMMDDKLKPIMDKQGSYLTQDSLLEVLGKAQQNAAIQKQFKLNDEELKEATEKAAENNIDLEVYCWRNHGKRVLGTSLGKELRDELNNGGDTPPPDPGSDTKTPKNGELKPDEFYSKYRELGPDKMKDLIRQKLKAEKQNG